MEVFLFTDLEGSTRLWEEHPEEMPVALGRHDEILADAIQSAGGSIVKTTGDGLMAVFESAAASVSASLAAQQALLHESWPTGDPLRVRIGLHAGESEHRGGDYFGPAVNRTARIMAAGHGGQVLLSGLVAELSKDRLPPGASLVDLGMHRLKDLTLPEHLYQLVHDGLPSAFPPLLTLGNRPNNLPLQTTEFFGRESEMTAIKAMLDSPGVRLVTIVGPGGAGKTRLGLQVAADLMDRFDDGVFFVDLSHEHDPNAAFEAIARALELPTSRDGDPVLALQAGLRDRKALLVLDNFEQVTEAAAGVMTLIQHCPELKVLVTSRETLRVRAEHVYPVPPLTLPDPRGTVETITQSEAVRLFAARATAVRPGFTITEENARAIAEICLRLDGLPLAIELAAARLNVFTPAGLLDRLRSRLDVLGAGGRDLPDRQRTLWGAIGWSYELLDESERRIFELMSVFSPARLEAVEWVAAASLEEAEVIDALGSLVDKSLLRSDDRGESMRFSMLATIREYAAERLAASPERNRTIRRAHATYYSDYAQALQPELRGRGRGAALEALAGEIGNLRTAWRFWVDQGDLQQLFLLLDSLWALHDAKGWYHSAIELASDTLGVLATAEPSPDLAAEELTLRTSLARALMMVRGYDVEVEQAFKRVLEMSEGVTGTRQFPVLRALANYYQNTMQWESAKRMGLQLLELGASEEDQSIVMEGHFVTGASIAFMGDLEGGLPHLERAIELFDPAVHGAKRFRLGPHTGVSARVASGLLRWQAGDLQQAVSRVGEALAIAEQLDHPYSIAYALYHNGFLEMARNRPEECRRRAQQLAEVASRHDYPVWKTLATVLEGISLTMLGQLEEGLTMTEAGVELYQGLTTPPVFWPLLLNLRGLVHGAAGHPRRGLELIDEAIGLGGGGAPPEFHISKGDVLMMLPEPAQQQAEEEYAAALQTSREAGLCLHELQALTRLVRLRRRRGLQPDGGDELRKLYDSFTSGLDEHDLRAAREVLGIGPTASSA